MSSSTAPARSSSAPGSGSSVRSHRPIRNLVYLAGANLGSGWASIGQGQVARWGRFVFERGAQRGVKVLQSLELGSSPTIDLHLSFTRGDSRMVEDYKVQEFVIIGTQADAAWFEFPDSLCARGWFRRRRARLRLQPEFQPFRDRAERERAVPALADRASGAGCGRREGGISGILRGEIIYPPRARIGRSCPAAFRTVAPIRATRWGSFPARFRSEQVERMFKLALETPERTPAAWQRAVAAYDRETAQTFDSARTMQKPGLFNFLADPRNQYDPHAQVDHSVARSG